MPIVLIISTALVFRYSSIYFGLHKATFIGFLFYQIIWCILIPLLFLGSKDFLLLFKPQQKLFQKRNWWLIILLFSTIGGSLVYFYNGLMHYSLIIFLIGIPVTILNGVCEEIFWRGLFVKTFNKRILFSLIYPTVCFSVWHIPSQLVHLNFNILSSLPFVLKTLPLGIIYSLVSYKTESILWNAIAHSIIGILAFGVPLSTSIYALIN